MWPVLLVNVGKLGESVSVPFVKTMSVGAGAPRCNSESGKAAFPGPGFNVFAESQADLTIAMAVLND